MQANHLVYGISIAILTVILGDILIQLARILFNSPDAWEADREDWEMPQ